MPPLRRALVAALALSGPLAAQRPLNLLFYGNSYSADNASVPALVGVIASAAGQATPRIVPRLAGGMNLTFHFTDPAQVAAITTSLPVSEFWDYVVIQGMSTEATHLGNPTTFRAAALGIVQNVRAHSPAAKAVLYQTWARAYGHTFYPGAFANPMAMQNEVRVSYQLAVDDINQAFGPGTARLARVGEAMAALAFSPSLYVSDLSHPRQPITLVAGMTIYTALWQDALCGLNPEFTQQTPIGRHFIGNGFTAQMWNDMRGYADLVAERSLRRFPGSGDDLVLRAGTGTSLLPCARIDVPVGGNLRLEEITPNWTYNNVTAGLVLDLVPVSPSPSFPELFVGHGRPVVLAITASLSNRLSLTVPIPMEVSGNSLIVQGIVLGPSTRTRNPLFCTSDGIEVRFQ